MAATGLAVTGAALGVSGCGTFYDDCTNGLCEPFKGEVTNACEGDPTTDSKLVTEACGLFVDSSAPAGGTGTKDKPFKTFKAALDAVTADAVKWIFVCNKPMTESVAIAKAKIKIYGGFDCAAGWTYKAAARSKLTGPANLVALNISGQNAEITDLDIEAVDATNPGGSSVAVLVQKANPSFERCNITAGQGKDGADGADASVAAAAGMAGNIGGDTCSAATVKGAVQMKNSCGMIESIGGKGGDGTAVNALDGSQGVPIGLNNQGKPGQGDDGSPQWTCDGSLGRQGDGNPGEPGLPGMDGSGASASDLGKLAPTAGSVLLPASGGDGETGHPGQGGGGAGGAIGGSGANMCVDPAKAGGASGGSGGAGGCGGLGGKGGAGGGASIALVSIESPALTLKDSTLKAGAGGAGGKGGKSLAGAAGGPGGIGGANTGASGLKSGCKGGDGAQGGDGGLGGGGRGGHSIGLAYTVKLPSIDAKVITVGTPGKGGLGGKPSVNDGSDGAVAPIQKF